MMSRASLAGHSARSILFKQKPQLSYPASQREHGKAADEESASNRSAAVGMPGLGAAGAGVKNALRGRVSEGRENFVFFVVVLVLCVFGVSFVCFLG